MDQDQREEDDHDHEHEEQQEEIAHAAPFPLALRQSWLLILTPLRPAPCGGPGIGRLSPPRS